MANTRSTPTPEAACSPNGSRRSGSSSASTWTATAIRRPFVRSVKPSDWRHRPPCTPTLPTSSGRGCCVATRRSRVRSSSSAIDVHAAPANAPSRPELPLLGQIAAGSPLLAEENVEDEIAVPEPLGRGADFLLRVKGDSMVDAGILDGDTLVVHRSRMRRTERS